jgi:hypothetical protein
VSLQTRLGRLLWWLLPIVFLFSLYSDGIQTWFLRDDFNWLGLTLRVHNLRDLLSVLFAPAAQGTIRPWSDRGFFLLFGALFGLNSLPYRIFAFATMAADVALVAWLTRRITKSPAAGFFAAILWTANTALVMAMIWSSAFNQALCLLFLLIAMALFIKYAETGRRMFWWGQLIVFTLGFGALEANIIYPALAAAYVLFVAAAARRKKLLLSLVPLFGISVLYFLLHFAVAPPPRGGPYAIHIDSRVFLTLAVYCKWALRPAEGNEAGLAARMGAPIFWILAIALAAFVIRQIAKARYQVLFFATWFLIGLAPVATLPEHRSDYYLAIPLVGLAMLGGAGIAQERRTLLAYAAIIPLALYLGEMIPASRVVTRQWLDRSLAARGLVLGVEAAHKTHPGKAIVLDGLTNALYYDVVYWPAFYPIGLGDVYLTPGSENNIDPANKSDKLLRIVLDRGTLWHAVTHDQAGIYTDVGGQLRNDTEIWQSPSRRFEEIPSRVEAGNPLFAYLMGPEWSRMDAGLRWIERRATVRLGGPRSAEDKLVLEGQCPGSQLSGGEMNLSVSVDGIPLADTQIDNPERNFRRLFALPQSLAGRPSVEVAISVDHAFHEPGEPEPGLFLGTIAFEH